MTFQTLARKMSAACVAAAALASATAQADTLVIEQEPNLTMAFQVEANGTIKKINAGLFSVNDLSTGTSFVAFCNELLQGISSAAMITGLDYTPTASVAASVQSLYDNALPFVHLDDASDVVGFQIALWEAMDDGDMSTGSLQKWASLSSSTAAQDALENAWIYLQFMNDQPSAHYSLVSWTNPNSQDLISVGQVPEPGIAALGVLGLGGLLAFRRRQTQG